MKTYDSGYSGKKKSISKKGEGGHAFVSRMVGSLSKEKIQRIWDGHNNRIQTKLEISQPQDAAEMQADKVAEGVIQGDTKVSKAALTQNPVSEINTKSEGSNMQTTDAFDSQLQNTKGQGQKLDNTIQTELEQHTGTDLSGVNIHTNSKASELSENINAKAFTHGQDIYFKEGQYNTTSNEGKSLLAHEVAHTVQQGEGKVQLKIQRLTNTHKRPHDIEQMPHAEGKLLEDPQKGWYVKTPATFPKTEEYYTLHPAEKAKMLADHPGTTLKYNTLYSLAERFMITVDDLNKANPGIVAEQIKVGDRVYIPYVPMPTVPIPPKKVTSISNTPVIPQLKLIPREQMYGPVVEVKDPVGYANYKEKQSPKPADVKAAANAILKDNPRIKSVMMFLGKIKTQNPNGTWQDWEAELEKFLTGPYTPDLSFEALKATGGTPKENAQSDLLSQPMYLNEKNTFSIHVATYLHELNHYIDMWYSSPAAQNLKISRPGSEFGKGIKPVSKNQKISTTDSHGNTIEAILNDPTESEHLIALPEYLTALTEQILRDMQEPTPQPDEHWLVPKLREKLQHRRKWVSTDEFIKDKRKKIHRMMIRLYGKDKEWNLEDNNALTATGAEQGYAFERAAYGFVELAGQQNVDKSKWAGNFQSNFEKTFWTYLQ